MHRHFVLKTIGARLGLALTGFLVGFIVVEIGLIIVGYSYPVLYIADEQRGWSLRPNISGNGTQEGHGFVNVNSNGLRDREYSKQKSENTTRIAVLGDSFTEAQHVDAENTFSSILEDQLKMCQEFNGKNIEAINFGVSAYGTTQELITLRHFAWDYSPDIVLLTFVSNDIRDNYFNGGIPTRPYFFLQGDHLVLDNSFREHPEYKFKQSYAGKLAYSLVNHSRILQLLKHSDLDKRAKSIISSTMSNASLFFNSTSEAAAQLSVSDHRTEGTAPVVEKFDEDAAWIITERILLVMNREVMDHNAKLIIMVVTSDPIYDPNIPRDKALNLPLHDYESRIRDIGVRFGIPVIMLSPEFRKHAYDHQVYLHGFVGDRLGVGHWNELGHDLAGYMASKFICEISNRILDE